MLNNIIQKSNKTKKIVIYIILVILLGIGFYIYYHYYAKGFLKIISNTSGIDTIQVISTDDGKQFYTAEKQDKYAISLKPGYYEVVVKKEGYLPAINYIEIKKMQWQKMEFILPKIISNLDENAILGSVTNLNSNDQAIYYFDDDDKSVNKINLTDNSQEKIYKFPDEYQEYDFSNINMTNDNGKVSVMASNQVTMQAVNLIVDLSSQKIFNLGDEYLQTVWVDDQTIAYLVIQNNKSVIGEMLYNGENKKQLLSEDKMIYKIDAKEGNEISYIQIANNQATIKILNIQNSVSKDLCVINDINYSIFPVTSWKNNPEKIIVYNPSNSKYYIVSSTGAVNKLDIDPVSTQIIWNDKNSILYFDKNGNSDKKILMQYNIDNKTKTTKTFYSSYESKIINQNKLILNNNLLGTE